MMWSGLTEAIRVARQQRQVVGQLQGLDFSSEEFIITARNNGKTLRLYTSTEEENKTTIAYLKGLGYRSIRINQVK